MRDAIDGTKLAALLLRWRAICADPVTLRACTAAVLLAVGLLAIEAPQAARLRSAREHQRDVEERANASDELRDLEKQVKRYGSRLATNADPLDWESYVSEKLAKSGAVLRAMEPKKTASAGPFTVVDIDLVAQGTYAELADFVDRLERGERLVRLDRIFVQRMGDTVNLECTIKGLAKPPSARAATDPEVPHG